MPDTKRAMEILANELHALGFHDTENMTLRELTHKLEVERFNNINHDSADNKWF